MKPKQKWLILIFVLIAPYLAVMVFLMSRYPPNHIPAWIPLGGGCYLLATIIFVGLFGRRIVKVQPVPAASTRPQAATTARLWAAYLIAVWSGFFLYGAFKFLKGEIPVERAVPAGALLLAFILVFAWFLRRDIKSRGVNKPTP